MSSVMSIGEIQRTYNIEPSNRKIDPYSLFEAHKEALGGDYLVKNDRNSYLEGTLIISGNRYDVEEYTMNPLKSKRVVYRDSEEIYSSGDDGVSVWSKTNGKVNSFSDLGTDRDLREKLDNLEYMDSDSSTFKVDTPKVKTIDGKQVYEVKITNNKNEDEVFQYYDTKSLMLNKEKFVYANRNDIEISYDNYRDVGGVKKAYSKTTRNLDTNKKESILVKSYKRNIMMNKTEFDIPEDDEPANGFSYY